MFLYIYIYIYIYIYLRQREAGQNAISAQPAKSCCSLHDFFRITVYLKHSGACSHRYYETPSPFHWINRWHPTC